MSSRPLTTEERWDVMGTLGWRPDLLTRLEATYPAGLPR